MCEQCMYTVSSPYQIHWECPTKHQEYSDETQNSLQYQSLSWKQWDLKPRLLWHVHQWKRAYTTLDLWSLRAWFPFPCVSVFPAWQTRWDLGRLRRWGLLGRYTSDIQDGCPHIRLVLKKEKKIPSMISLYPQNAVKITHLLYILTEKLLFYQKSCIINSSRFKPSCKTRNVWET